MKHPGYVQEECRRLGLRPRLIRWKKHLVYELTHLETGKHFKVVLPATPSDHHAEMNGRHEIRRALRCVLDNSSDLLRSGLGAKLRA